MGLLACLVFQKVLRFANIDLLICHFFATVPTMIEGAEFGWKMFRIISGDQGGDMSSNMVVT